MNKVIKVIKNNYITRKKILEDQSVFYYFKSSKGYILLIVLVISAFLVSFTSEFFYKTHIYISYIKRFRADLSSEYLAFSGFELAKTILDVDRLGLASSFMPNLSSNRSIDSLKDIWALDFPEMDLPGGRIKIKIEDENSKINISVLANEFVEKTYYYGVLQRFIGNLGLSLDIADCILDWIDPDSMRSPYGAESSDYYQTLSPPYSAHNAEMDSIGELLLVKLITPEIYYGFGGGNYGLEQNLVDDNKGDVSIPLYKLEDITKIQSDIKEDSRFKETIEKKIGKEKNRKLADYLRVHGKNDLFTDDMNKININTASFRVLSSLSNEMYDDVVTDIIRQRQLQPFKSISEVKTFLSDTKYETISKLITVKSYIFKITVNAENDNGLCRLICYYDRDNKKILYYSTEH